MRQPANFTSPVGAAIRHVDYFRVARDPGTIQRAAMVSCGENPSMCKATIWQVRQILTADSVCKSLRFVDLLTQPT